MQKLFKRLMAAFVSPTGEVIPVRNLWKLGLAIAQSANRKLANRYPERLFIPFSAATAIHDLLKPSDKIVEVGAGYSTVFLAKHCANLISYEWDAGWFKRISEILDTKGLDNTKIIFQADPEGNIFEDIEDGTVDFLFVDGGKRSKCLRDGWPKVKPGGIVYLDDTNEDSMWKEDGIDAWQFLEARKSEIAETEKFVDYAPAAAWVKVGTLITKR